VYDQTQGSGAVFFFYITENFNTLSALAQIMLLLEMMKLSQKNKKTKTLFLKNNFV
jgi:hypothetical protein